MENRDEDLHFQKMNKFFIESSKKKRNAPNTNPFLLGKQTDFILEEFQNSYIRIDTSIETNPEYQLINGWTNIILMNEGAKTIGYLNFKIYNSFIMDKSDLLKVAKSFSDEEYTIISTFKKHFQSTFDEGYIKFLIVNEIFLNNEYQQKGYELKVMVELISLCRILEIDYIISKPLPIIKENFNYGKSKKQMAKMAFLNNKLVFDVYYLEEQEPIIVLDISRI